VTDTRIVLLIDNNPAHAEVFKALLAAKEGLLPRFKAINFLNRSVFWGLVYYGKHVKQIPYPSAPQNLPSFHLAGCGKSRKSCNEAAQNASNVHARN
jgi:hypothetical protein